MGKRFKLPKDIHTCDRLMEIGVGKQALVAVGLLAVATSWARKHETGGVVPREMLRHWGAVNVAPYLVPDYWIPVYEEDGQWRGDYRFAEWER